MNTRSDLSFPQKQSTPEQGTHEGAYFEPAVDIYETPEKLVLTADVPGTTAEAIQTDLRDNLLTITAPLKAVDAKWKPVYEEYHVGNYLRQFRLGQQIDQSRISAELKDGVLTLHLPKADHAKARRIQVQTR